MRDNAFHQNRKSSFQEVEQKLDGKGTPDKDADHEEKIVIEDESIRYMPEVDRTSDTQNTRNEVDENDVNDDLLQIPAFLRRQAN